MYWMCLGVSGLSLAYCGLNLCVYLSFFLRILGISLVYLRGILSESVHLTPLVTISLAYLGCMLGASVLPIGHTLNMS